MVKQKRGRDGSAGIRLTLTPEAKVWLGELAESRGLARSQLVEVWIREEHKREERDG